MKLPTKLLILSLLSVLPLPDPAAADRYLRCQGRLVSIGDTAAEVLDKCAEPDKLDQWEEFHSGSITQMYDYKTERYIAPKDIGNPTLMERWTYNLGHHQFTRYLYFQNGELIRIETGEKGRD